MASWLSHKSWVLCIFRMLCKCTEVWPGTCRGNGRRWRWNPGSLVSKAEATITWANGVFWAFLLNAVSVSYTAQNGTWKPVHLSMSFTSIMLVSFSELVLEITTASSRAVTPLTPCQRDWAFDTVGSRFESYWWPWCLCIYLWYFYTPFYVSVSKHLIAAHNTPGRPGSAITPIV